MISSDLLVSDAIQRALLGSAGILIPDFWVFFGLTGVSVPSWLLWVSLSWHWEELGSVQTRVLLGDKGLQLPPSLGGRWILPVLLSCAWWGNLENASFHEGVQELGADCSEPLTWSHKGWKC